MKITGLLVSFLFLISSALQADTNSFSSFDFDRDINIPQTLEKAHAQDVNIIPAVSQSENKYGYDDSNEPNSIDHAARMLDDAIHRLGISAKVIVHESEPPFIKAIIGPLTGGQYGKMMKLFSREDGNMYYYGYKILLDVTSVRNKSNEPDSIDDAARMLEKEIRAIGILGAVIVHESEPPFIKATIGAMTNVQHKSMMKLFTYENGDRLYYGYKVQLNMFLPRNKYGYDDSNAPDSIDDAARRLDDAIHRLGVSAKVIVHESEPPFIKAIIGPLTGGQYSKMMKLFSREEGSFYYYGYKVHLKVSAIKNKYGYDDSNEPDSIDHAARMLDDKIREMGISAMVLVHESEPPFIKVSIGGLVNSIQYGKVMNLFGYEDGKMVYYGYEVQLKMFMGNKIIQPQY